MVWIRTTLMGVIFLLLQQVALSQADSCRIRVSLLTCGPGTDLYSIWGHTGIRLIDSARQLDVVFNYGTFDASDPLFYLKFTRGIMMYAVAPYSFADFMEEYRLDKRSVTEQVLAMDCAEKQQLAAALWKNAAEENRYYAYHFYADNCTTRARDMLTAHMNNLQFSDIRPSPGVSTYRQLIHSYMNNSGQAWNRFGIDVLLGNHLDEIMNNRQAMFLPDYLLKGFDGASRQHQPLVVEKLTLLPAGGPDDSTFFTPVFLFSLLLVLFLVLTLVKSNKVTQAVWALDNLVFLLVGLLGVLMLALWLGRVDNVCRNNLNLLWALPSHTVLAFVSRRKRWVRYYWLATAVINALLLVTWKWLPQDMNSSLILLILILLIRSIIRYRQPSAL